MNVKNVKVTEQIKNVAIDQISPCKYSPFKVNEDDKMKELVESISMNGIITPLIVRTIGEDKYEVVSGHRRLYAAGILGKEIVPVIIKKLNDADAQIAMVDSNLMQREYISYSEKAAAYKIRFEAMRKKPGRKKRGQDDHKKGKKTIDLMAEDTGESSKQIQRYIKLNELIPELMELLDTGKLSFTPAEQLAYLRKDDQKKVLEAMDYCAVAPSLSQAMRLKKQGMEGELSLEVVIGLLGEVKKGDVQRVVFKNEVLYQFFPRSYTVEMMQQEILYLLIREYGKKGCTK